VHKKGPTNLLENYRPVSNINSIAKLYELCVLQRLESFDQDESLGYAQHGFRKRHSTTTAVVEIVDSICEARENKNLVAIYSADLTAAFDILRKEKLAEIMIEKGYPGYLINTIYDYLSDRTGYVQLNESRSCVKDIKTGCVQGSILGPYLFNLYTSNLYKIIQPSRSTVYADDSYIVVSAKNEEMLEAMLKLTLKDHFSWLRSIGMVCNMSKTELMVFGVDDLSVEIDGEKITSKENMKILGIIVDNKLTWNAHVNRLVSKCRSYLYPLRYIRKHLSTTETLRV